MVYKPLTANWNIIRDGNKKTPLQQNKLSTYIKSDAFGKINKLIIRIRKKNEACNL